MLRLLALTGVLLTALVGAGSAHALSEPQSTLLRQLSQAELKALIQDIDAQGLQTSGSSNVKTGVTRMQIAAGRIAPLRALGTIGLGSVVVWKIADSLGAGGFVYKLITGTDPPGTGAPSYVAAWQYCSGVVETDDGQCQPGQGFESYLNGVSRLPAGWVLTSVGTSFADRPSYCDPRTATGCVSSALRNLSDQMIAVGGAGTTTPSLTVPNACSTSTASECVIRGRTDYQMHTHMQMQPSDAAEFASPPAGATTATAGTNDTTTPTDLELEAALDEIDPSPGTTGTAVEQETAEAILDELDPGWDHEFITLLQPEINETYTDYVTRLQAAGWLGTATSTVLASENGAYGPEAVVRVTYTQAGTTTVRTLDPLQWPASAPQIELNDDITIRYNPDTAAPAPTEGTGTGTQVTWPGTTVPSAPAIDFSPVTDIDFGCKFPYGFLCYAVDFTEQFDVAADAPVFTFDMEMDVALGSFDLGTYSVDLNVMDDWMALWRDILSVVLVVGAIYLVATRMLGFKAGGDPGAAMDDVL